jgi:hypothetical protein
VRSAAAIVGVDHHDPFSTETTGFWEASSRGIARLYDGDGFDLRIHPVRKRIGDAEVRMLGRNGGAISRRRAGMQPVSINGIIMLEERA